MGNRVDVPCLNELSCQNIDDSQPPYTRIPITVEYCRYDEWVNQLMNDVCGYSTRTKLSVPPRKRVKVTYILHKKIVKGELQDEVCLFLLMW